jgi:GNAT superfamily N-acetyltransferase
MVAVGSKAEETDNQLKNLLASRRILSMRQGPHSNETDPVSCHFRKPEDIPPKTLAEIRDLVAGGGAVGTSWIEEMLQGAYLIGYAETSAGRVVGCEVLKHPKESYRKKIETAAGLDLSGYLERGYLAVAEAYRGRGIAESVVGGLIERTKDQWAYTAIRMDNHAVVRMTEKHGMRLAGRFVNPRTGHEIGIFVRTPPGTPRRTSPSP